MRNLLIDIGFICHPLRFMRRGGEQWDKHYYLLCAIDPKRSFGSSERERELSTQALRLSLTGKFLNGEPVMGLIITRRKANN